jgi:hypothetical protein
MGYKDYTNEMIKIKDKTSQIYKIKQTAARAEFIPNLRANG